MDLRDLTRQIEKQGYHDEDAAARVCQDIVLKAIAQSPLSKKVTIKGGVVMRSLTGNVRRATQDMDIDFIRYSLSEDSAHDLRIYSIYIIIAIRLIRNRLLYAWIHWCLMTRKCGKII